MPTSDGADLCQCDGQTANTDIYVTSAWELFYLSFEDVTKL